MDREELLERYARGERNFAGVDLHGVDLSGAVLRNINFDRADLSEVNFSGADLRGNGGRRLSLRFKETSGISTNPGEYSSSGLGRAMGGYSCIRYAVLKNAVFKDTDISYVDFTHSDLSFADLDEAYGYGMSFDCCYLLDTKLGMDLEIASYDGAMIEGTILENEDLYFGWT